ncbi:MAG: CRISPR-associated endonuclease Cas2 [Candidatus Margulisbacteria bacterium]|nr:CRISPR-associated endonuclease Cas2 [Candidatus Margulisiibacteriota bacterium]
MRDEFGRFDGMFIITTFDIMESPDTSSMQKRLRKLTKVLKGFGKRVQKSVFECYLDNPQIEIMRDRISKIIETDLGDNVRFYKLCNSCYEKIEVLGERGVSEEDELYIL